jgi:hypothetical protein
MDLVAEQQQDAEVFRSGGNPINRRILAERERGRQQLIKLFGYDPTIVNITGSQFSTGRTSFDPDKGLVPIAPSINYGMPRGGLTPFTGYPGMTKPDNNTANAGKADPKAISEPIVEALGGIKQTVTNLQSDVNEIRIGNQVVQQPGGKAGATLAETLKAIDAMRMPTPQ